MTTATRQSTRQTKKVERFADIQESLTKGRYHGWNDTWVRGFNGHEGTNNVFISGNLSEDNGSSGYLNDGFIVEDSESEFGSDSESEFESEFESESESESESEDFGIGCNKCYSCVSGGSGPCVLYEEEEEAEFDE